MSRTANSSRIKGGRIAFAVHSVLLVLVVGWLWGDPLAERFLGAVRDVLGNPLTKREWAKLPQVGGSWRVAGMIAFVGVWGCAIGAECLRFLRKRAGNVSLRRMLSFVALIGVWCAICLQAHNVMWEGKRWRAQRRLAALDKLATELTNDWPSEDGEIEGLGPFTAYPFGKPQVLLLLTPYPLAGTNTVVAAVEKGSDGQLRFQLGGADGGVWVERHRPESRPKSFVGGLADSHELSRTAELNDGWYLVRYGS